MSDRSLTAIMMLTIAVIVASLTAWGLHRGWKPGKRFWLKLTAFLIIYPLSWGPVSWLGMRSWLPEAVIYLYLPVLAVHKYGPWPIRRLFIWYFDLWV